MRSVAYKLSFNTDIWINDLIFRIDQICKEVAQQEVAKLAARNPAWKLKRDNIGYLVSNKVIRTTIYADSIIAFIEEYGTGSEMAREGDGEYENPGRSEYFSSPLVNPTRSNSDTRVRSWGAGYYVTFDWEHDTTMRVRRKGSGKRGTVIEANRGGYWKGAYTPRKPHFYMYKAIERIKNQALQKCQDEVIPYMISVAFSDKYLVVTGG